jgi:translation initiation factor IF-2
LHWKDNGVKKVKVKSLAEKYGVSPKVILEELLSEGIVLEGAASIIPADMVTLIEEHLDSVFGVPPIAEEEAPAGVKPVVKVKDKKKAPAHGDQPEKPPAVELHLKTPVIVKQLAEAVGKKPNEVISDLMGLGEFASINQSITEEIAAKLCSKYGFELVIDHREKEHGGHHVTENGEPAESKFEQDEQEKPEDLKERPPVVTFLGHVDHGKTSLQDKIRNTKVADGEAGKITQHIGASIIEFKGKSITFIDTPGHEAFTQMRARGANVTDIAILVVSAEDGFMPQTVEALNQIRAAGVPLIVAINKIDLPSANPDKIILQMQQNNLSSEDWGGDVGVVRVSAKTGQGIDDLLERILMEAELLELKASSKCKARGTVLESQLEQGQGPTANVIIQKGTLNVGEIVLCGEHYGKVKTMLNAAGERIRTAGPSTPVKLVGLSGVPNAGSKLVVCANEKEARLEAEKRTETSRNINLVQVPTQSLEDLFTKISDSTQNMLNLIIKSDVKGSGEAIIDSLKKIPSDKIKVNTILSGVGAITENDIMLAAAAHAIVVGFHVRVNPGVNEIAKKQKVEIRLYSIIYELLEDITDALTGRLAPEKRERELGTATILQIFEVSKGPKVCGCMVEKGTIRVGAKARVFRNKELIYNGEVLSLRRFQDDVKEVKVGLECGIRLDNFVDFLEKDLIEVYDIELQKAKL